MHVVVRGIWKDMGGGGGGGRKKKEKKKKGVFKKFYNTPFRTGCQF